MSAPTIPPQQAATIRRSQRLRITLNSEGWADVMKIMDAVVDDALDLVDKYTGVDEKQLAMLTASWKTLKAAKANFLATLKSQIDEGDETAKQFTSPKPQPQAKTAEEHMPSATAVRPLCDVVTEMEKQDDAGTKSE